VAHTCYQTTEVTYIQRFSSGQAAKTVELVACYITTGARFLFIISGRRQRRRDDSFADGVEAVDARPAARDKTRQANAPEFPVREALCRGVGTDRSQGHGGRAYTAWQLIGACGSDMRRWPTVKPYTSWLTLAPGHQLSGGKWRSATTRRSSNRAATTLRLAAVSVGRTHTALGAFEQRLAARIGKANAVTATACQLAVLLYHTLRDGMAYQDPGASYSEAQYRRRLLTGRHRRAKALGDERVAVGATAGVS
jgi:transposase